MSPERELEFRVARLLADVYATPNCMICMSPVGEGKSGGAGGTGHHGINGVHVLVRYCDKCTAELMEKGNKKMPRTIAHRVRWLILQGWPDRLQEVVNDRNRQE